MAFPRASSVAAAEGLSLACPLTQGGAGVYGVVGVFHSNYARTDIRYIIANCFDFIRNFHNEGVRTPDSGLWTPWLLWMIAICNQCTTSPPPFFRYFILFVVHLFSLASASALAFWLFGILAARPEPSKSQTKSKPFWHFSFG